mgnify:CR=1 FL=1
MIRYGKSWSECRSPQAQEDYWVVAIEKAAVLDALLMIAAVTILGLAFYGFCVLVMLFL